MQTRMPMGYKMVDGKIEIDNEKAKVVKRIFKDYQSGMSLIKIASTLKEERVKNANNKTNWTHGAIGRILENVKYMGDYFYPPLIKKEQYEMVQEMRKAKENQLGRTMQLNAMKNRSMFLDKIICGECGEPYRKYVEHSGKSYEKVKWKCKKYIYKNKVLCTNIFYTDEEIRQIIVNAINQLIKNPKLVSSNPPPKTFQRNVELAEVENRINELQENDEMSSAELVKLIYTRAQIVYNSTKINDY
ncbi:MAG: recombinase family protein, partial [Anaerotignaceae bacterium]